MPVLLSGLLAMLTTAAPWETTTVDEFVVVGIAARTSNAREMTAGGIIGRQWQRFMQEGVLAQIQGKADAKILAVYTDYASDKDGEYTFLLGAKVDPSAPISTGLSSRIVPAGRYAIFTSERGPAAKVVPETWKRIWAAPLGRAYRADFEVYDERAADPQNARVAIWVGLK
jgi:predicted transcriptional regulator YdeE